MNFPRFGGLARRAGSPSRLTFLAALTTWIVATSCASPATDDPLAVQVVWGLTGTSALPADVAEIEVTTCVFDGETEQCDPTTCSIAALTLTRVAGAVESCRPEEGTEAYGDDPVLVRRGFVPGSRVRFRFEGRDEASVPTYTGHAGPFVIGEGERRLQRVQMYPLRMAMAAPGASVGRILHTATYLPDGRVLVAGGFDVSSGTCPAALGLPDGASCFDLTATDEAVVFDVASRTLAPVRAPMLGARGGHSATSLPDGRVLLAGGAVRAILATVPQGDGAVSGYRVDLIPLDEDGEADARDDYEIFDAYLGEAAVDADRDGDLGRGRFLGIAGTSTPGPLNQPRFLHAAAAIEAAPGQVLLAGGLGSNTTARTYEVFDYQRAGGYGVYQGGGNLSVARALPGAVSVLGSQVWIFGGGPAASAEELADVWEADPEDPNGSVTPASEVSSFPGTGEHPDYALERPAVASIAGGNSALVVGWYGPRCEIESDTPVFAGGSVDTERCSPPPAGGTRSFTVEGSSGSVAPTAARNHAFGATARLLPFEPGPDEGAAITGGATNRLFTAQSAIDVYSGAVDPTGAAQSTNVAGASLAAPRLFHTSTGVPGYGVVTVGGLSFATASLDRVVLRDEVEVLFLGL